MNRKYDTKEFRKIVSIIRENYEDAKLTTDIIVGFPGETNEEFEKTKSFLEEIKFYKMHIFKYSARKGTIASTLKEQVDVNKKEERSKILLEMSDKFQNEYNQKYIGKSLKVLIEEYDNNFYKGHTKNYIEVFGKGKKDFINKIIDIKIEKQDKNNNCLIGNIIDKN